MVIMKSYMMTDDSEEFHLQGYNAGSSLRDNFQGTAQPTSQKMELFRAISHHEHRIRRNRTDHMFCVRGEDII